MVKSWHWVQNNIIIAHFDINEVAVCSQAFISLPWLVSLHSVEYQYTLVNFVKSVCTSTIIHCITTFMFNKLLSLSLSLLLSLYNWFVIVKWISFLITILTLSILLINKLLITYSQASCFLLSTVFPRSNQTVYHIAIAVHITKLAAMVPRCKTIIEYMGDTY